MIKPLNSVRRRRDRYEFAKHLRLLADFPIQQARLKYTNHAPYNQNIEPPSLLLPGSVCDHLCQSLRYFSQLESLFVLDINEAVISPELFWPSDINAEAPFWPNLSILHVFFDTMTADGGWYYERNPHATPDKGQRGWIYNTDDWFRSWPSPKMEALLRAMARAVTRMPRLRQFSAGTWFYDHDRGYGVNFEFFYLRAGEQQVVCDAKLEHDNVAKQRLLWHVPELWRMSDAVEQLWRETLGQDGTIEYQEWDD
ncbi:hypothetical protein D6C92_07244 [Aureobasidium pullulans]|nr:hypothetical protein D6C92_07244 [Aureobasidium pullulans]